MRTSHNIKITAWQQELLAYKKLKQKPSPICAKHPRGLFAWNAFGVCLLLLFVYLFFFGGVCFAVVLFALRVSVCMCVCVYVCARARAQFCIAIVI